MRMFTCPRCRRESITSKDKRKAGYWANIYCPHCKAKLCAYPWVLAALWVLYVWDVGWFAGMYHYTDNYFHFLYMAIGWAVVDYINISFIPLAVMKQAPQT